MRKMIEELVLMKQESLMWNENDMVANGYR
jgi:hypothetical protein